MLAFNHFHWLDPPVFGARRPRTVYFMAKVEAHRVPGLGQLIRSFGTISVRRGESDREAVRLMREAVRDGHALGLFVEGTRQRDGVPGRGAARRRDGGAAGGRARRARCHPRHPDLAARQLGAGVGRLGRADALRGLPKGGKGYRRPPPRSSARSARLFDWLVEMHAAGPPAPRDAAAVSER